MKHSKLITQLVAVVITVLAGVAIAAANNWTPPLSTPPSGNADAPINTGNTAQIKSGGLVLGNGLAAGVPALVIPKGDFLLGTTVGQAAPNGGSGNIVANDLYITSVGKWASTLTAAAPPTTCTPTDWSPAVNAADVCTGTVATQFKTNADCTISTQPVAGTKDCTGSSYTPGEWFTDKLNINYVQSDPDGNWATKQDVTWTAPHALQRIRVRGISNDGGYCYAYWGSGSVATARHSGDAGLYTMDGLWYPYTDNATPVLQGPATLVSVYGDPAYSCSNYPGSYYNTYDPVTGLSVSSCYTYKCSDGGPVTYTPAVGGLDGVSTPDTWTCDHACPSNPPSFSADGTAKICQVNWGAGPMLPSDQPVAIPEGAVVHLQGRHTIGAKEDYIQCAMDIQYAP